MATYLDRGTYWILSIVGCICGLILMGIVGKATAYLKYHNSDHGRFEDYQAWRAETATQTLQHHLERFLADPSYPKEWMWDKNVQKAAEKIATLRHNPNLHQDLVDLHTQFEMRELAKPWAAGCSRHQYCPPLSVLDDEDRLTRIFMHQRSAITELPSAEVPKQFLKVATLREQPPEYPPRPTWWNWYLWAIFSVVYGFVYFVLGMIMYYKDNEPEVCHPFRAVPDFLLGWLLYLVWLPGYALGYALFALNLSLQLPLSTIGKAIKTLFLEPDADEYAEAYKALLKLQRQSAQSNKPEVLQDITACLASIDEARQANAAAALCEIKQKLQKTRLDVKAQIELDATTRQKHRK